MKYTLEIELENDNECYGCPCIDHCTRCYGCPCMDRCASSERYDGVPYSRPKECLLKEKQPVEENLNKACDLLHACLEWDNGGERAYNEIVEFLNEIQTRNRT